MKIAVDFGHGVGQDRGAVGILNEENVVREYGPLLIKKLRDLGHEVLNVTPTSATTLTSSLSQRTNSSNNFGADLFISCHVNCFDNSNANGCEVEYISQHGKIYADKICSNVSSLGFTNRGAVLRQNLYVLKHTNAVAILIEPFFCSNREDCKKYNAESLASAIVSAISGGKVAPHEAITNNTVQIDSWISRLQEECNRQGFSNQRIDGISGSNTLNGCPTCHRGARGNITRLLQEKLHSLGFDTNGIDGIFGGGTLNAVIAFQRSRGISSDGIVGKNTWKKLLGL